MEVRGQLQESVLSLTMRVLGTDSGHQACEQRRLAFFGCLVFETRSHYVALAGPELRALPPSPS